MARPEISIGILNLNGVARLRRCLPSLLRLEGVSVEWLVVDYGSTDGSLKYLRGFECVRVVHLEGGFHNARGRNHVVDEARGHFVLMVDNDIEFLEPDLPRRLLERYKALENVAFLSPLVLDVGTSRVGDVGLSMTRLQRSQEIARVRGHGAVDVTGYYGNCVLFRREIVAELGRFDEAYPMHNNDYDLGVRAHLHGYRVMIDTDCTVLHHGSSTRIDLAPVAWRYQYYLSSMLRIACKSYRLRNFLVWGPVIAGWIFAKALRLSWLNRSPRPLWSCARSLGFFLRDLPETVRLRRRVQATRREPQDRFLLLRPPVF